MVQVILCNINIAFVYHVFKKHDRGILVLPATNVFLLEAFKFQESWDDAAIKLMRKRSMAQVMHQTSHCHIANVTVVDSIVPGMLCVRMTMRPKLAPHVVQEPHLLLSKVPDPKTVRESCMGCAWKDMV